MLVTSNLTSAYFQMMCGTMAEDCVLSEVTCVSCCTKSNYWTYIDKRRGPFKLLFTSIEWWIIVVHSTSVLKCTVAELLPVILFSSASSQYHIFYLVSSNCIFVLSICLSTYQSSPSNVDHYFLSKNHVKLLANSYILCCDNTRNTQLCRTKAFEIKLTSPNSFWMLLFPFSCWFAIFLVL